MKNLSFGLNIVLLVAVIVLYGLYFSGKSCDVKDETETVCAKGASVVYVNTDSLLMKYNMSKDLNENFLKIQEGRRTELNIKMKALEKEAGEFQKKLQNNGFLTRERAEKAQMKILKKKQDLEKLQQAMSQKMRLEQQEMNKKLFDTLNVFLKKYNAKNNHDVILSTTLGGNVLYSKKGLDITNEIVGQLNLEYKK